jgi:SAM-dependent methyltransferase
VQDDETTRRAKSFEAGAAEYERLRPEFPEALFASIRDRAGHRLTGRVLEVGAGTGRATLPLVRLGASIDVVEPSADMLSVLSDRLDAEGYSDRVNLRQATFEDVDPQARYDMVVAAQSFHWTDPTMRWSRLGSLIRPDGRAFLFWNGWSLNPAVHDIAAVKRLYRSRAAGLQPDTEDHRSGPSWVESEIDAAPGIYLADTTCYDWDWRLPIQDYLGLLMTTSQYAVADPAVRRELFAALAEVLGTGVELNGCSLCLVVSPVAREETLSPDVKTAYLARP